MNYDPYLLTDLEFYKLYTQHELARVEYLLNKKKENAPDVRYNFIEFTGFTGFGNDSKLNTIKLLRKHSALGLKEAKDITDGLPCMFHKKYILSLDYTESWLNEVKNIFQISLHRN